MRSLLFIPGHSAKMMAKANSSGADVVIFDLEDAVHPDSKPAARQLVVDALANRANGSPAGYVRVNALDSAWCAGDLEAVMPGGPIIPPPPRRPAHPWGAPGRDNQDRRRLHRDARGHAVACGEILGSPAPGRTAVGRRRPVRGHRGERKPRRERTIYGAIRYGPRPLPVGRPRGRGGTDRRRVHRFSR